MWGAGAARRIFAYTKPTDMRKSFLWLLALVQQVFAEDPYAGHLFVFELQAAALDAALALAGRGNTTRVQPFALNLTQPTDFGTLYSIAELRELGEVAHRHGLLVHLDGARFANALAAIGCSPAEMTWRAGIDVVSFGATKNGAMNAEAVLVFEPAVAARADAGLGSRAQPVPRRSSGGKAQGHRQV